jgi:formylmethanofuran dehydrogenase subunit E
VRTIVAVISTKTKETLFMKRKPYQLALAIVLTMLAVPGHTETQDEWIALGTRIHGGFGPFIPMGIRIGLDAKEKLKPDARGLSILFYSGEKSPCPCIADGIMIATQASPGQGTLQIAAEKAPSGQLAVAIIRNRKTGEGLRYAVGEQWMPKVVEWLKNLDPAGRYRAVMSADGLFDVSPAPPQLTPASAK